MKESHTRVWVDRNSGMYLKLSSKHSSWQTTKQFELTYDLDDAYTSGSLIEVPMNIRLAFNPIDVVVKQTVEILVKKG